MRIRYATNYVFLFFHEYVPKTYLVVEEVYGGTMLHPTDSRAASTCGIQAWRHCASFKEPNTAADKFQLQSTAITLTPPRPSCPALTFAAAAPGKDIMAAPAKRERVFMAVGDGLIVVQRHLGSHDKSVCRVC